MTEKISISNLYFVGSVKPIYYVPKKKRLVSIYFLKKLLNCVINCLLYIRLLSSLYEYFIYFSIVFIILLTVNEINDLQDISKNSY